MNGRVIQKLLFELTLSTMLISFRYTARKLGKKGERVDICKQFICNSNKVTALKLCFLFWFLLGGKNKNYLLFFFLPLTYI